MKEPRVFKRGDDDEERDTAHGGTSQEPADEVSPGRVHIDVVVFERVYLLKEKKKWPRETGEDRRRCRGPRTSPRGRNTVRYTGASWRWSVEATADRGPRRQAHREGRQGRRRCPSRQAEADQQLEHRQTDRPTGLPKEGMGQEPGRMVVLPTGLPKRDEQEPGWMVVLVKSRDSEKGGAGEPAQERGHRPAP